MQVLKEERGTIAIVPKRVQGVEKVLSCLTQGAEKCLLYRQIFACFRKCGNGRCYACSNSSRNGDDGGVIFLVVGEVREGNEDSFNVLEPPADISVESVVCGCPSCPRHCMITNVVFGIQGSYKDKKGVTGSEVYYGDKYT